LKTFYYDAARKKKCSNPFLVITVIAALLFFACFSVYTMRPSVLKLTIGSGELTINKIETNDGNIVMKSSKETQIAVLMVSAAGSRDEPCSPWVRTGLQVKPNDKVRIEASGSVHTRLQKLIEIAQTDMSRNPQQYQSWVGPKGNHGLGTESDERRRPLRLLPDQPYGALVAALCDGKSPVKDDTKGAIDSEKNFEVKRQGELVLAVNDLLLNDKAQDLYALPVETNRGYYKSKLIEKEGESVYSWKQQKIDEESKKLRQAKLNAWDQIVQYNRWTVWLDDNIGEFFVSVTKKA
jgi:hypothetical protein